MMKRLLPRSVHSQTGAVSLFVVVFAMLLITVVTVSFLRLMTTDQIQASDTDLSQSAYDSAQAGVEDAKRALLWYQRVCSTNPAGCGPASETITKDVCNWAVVKSGVVDRSNVNGGIDDDHPGEIQVQKSVATNDKDLNQAYSCLKIKLATNDYIGNLASNESQIIPLIGDNTGGKDGLFDTVTVFWFSPDDLGTSGTTVDLENIATNAPLINKTAWPTTRPPVMRTQLIQFGTTFTLDNFDTVSGDESNANTVFLYPSSSGGASRSDKFTALDTRKTSATDDPDPDSPSLTPRTVRCDKTISSGKYSCQMSLTLPKAIGNTDDRRTAFLRLTPFYRGTHFKVILSKGVLNATGTNIVQFKDVQPEVDSTGRANDLYRRVLSRVDLYDTSFPYPDATIDVTGNFCKDFGVTDTEYIAGSCNP